MCLGTCVCACECGRGVNGRTCLCIKYIKISNLKNPKIQTCSFTIIVLLLVIVIILLHILPSTWHPEDHKSELHNHHWLCARHFRLCRRLEHSVFVWNSVIFRVNCVFQWNAFDVFLKNPSESSVILGRLQLTHIRMERFSTVRITLCIFVQLPVVRALCAIHFFPQAPIPSCSQLVTVSTSRASRSTH